GKAAIPTDGSPLVLEDSPKGYHLAFGSSVKENDKSKESSTLVDGIYTITQTAGYVLGENKITYNTANGTRLKLNGVATAPEKSSDGVLTLTTDNFNSNGNILVANNSGGYNFSIKKGTYTGKKFTGSSSAEIITNAGSKISISAGAGNDYITTSGSNVKVVGDAGNDTIVGGNGADYFLGGAGNDSLIGDAGNDSISGGADNDKLYGGAGNDTLWGGAGSDSLWGGEGADVFIYQDSDTGTDIIYDYDFNVDKIVATCSEVSVYSDGLDLCYKFTNGSLILKNALAQFRKNQ
ncbi:MAG: hypothetical protein IJT47_04980, partial [Selenomonadaceae bacterium]|nr:hypothetical protein [Selenomonadaceae bacterium]